MSQTEQHELPEEEGGGRLNWLLALLVLIVAMVMGVVLAAGVQSSGVRTEPSASTDSGDTNETANKGEVADLISHGGKAPNLPAAEGVAPPPIKLPPVTTQTAPHKPGPYQQWAEQKYMKALESPQVVPAFHSSALELPQARNQNSPQNFAQGDLASTGVVQLHAAPSPYTVMAGNIIPAVLVSGIDSDLPGPIVAQVRECLRYRHRALSARSARQQIARVVSECVVIRTAACADRVAATDLPEHFQHGHRRHAGR